MQRNTRPSLGAAVVVTIVATMLIATSSGAQIVIREHTGQALASCGDDHFYNPRTVNAPAAIARSFRGQGKLVTFRTCTDADGHTHYFVRKPRPNRNGICRIFEQELFPGTAKDVEMIDVLYDGMTRGWYFDLPGWKGSPPADWARLHYSAQSQILALENNDGCPPGDDRRYIPVGTLTDGMLSTFYLLWHRVSRSPDAFDDAFAKSVSNANNMLGFKEDHVSLVQRLRGELFDNGRQRPVIQMLECGEGRLDACNAYLSDRLVVGFDVTENGLAIKTIDVLSIP